MFHDDPFHGTLVVGRRKSVVFERHTYFMFIS